MSSVKERFPEYSTEQIDAKIRNTIGKFEILRTNSTHKLAGFQAFLLGRTIWFAAVRFDQRMLALSVYEHAREMRISSPAVVIQLSAFPETRTWIEREFNDLTERSILVNEQAPKS